MDFAKLGVSRETYERLEIYQQLLTKWQKKINLVSQGTLDQFWHRHIEDSIQCFQLKPHATNWVDIGSGGGFPGLVIAILLAADSDGSIRLIESNHKKCAFLRTVIQETGARGKVLACRAEDVVESIEVPEIVCARAVATLNTLLNMCAPWLTGNATALFHKGRNYRGELEETNDKWQYDLVEHTSAIDRDSVVLEIANLKERSG